MCGQDKVGETAMKWTNVMRTGGVEVRFTGIDLSTVMFNMQQGRHSIEVSLSFYIYSVC